MEYLGAVQRVPPAGEHGQLALIASLLAAPLEAAAAQLLQQPALAHPHIPLQQQHAPPMVVCQCYSPVHSLQRSLTVS